jgi:hypothetical protein
MLNKLLQDLGKMAIDHVANELKKAITGEDETAPLPENETKPEDDVQDIDFEEIKE